MPDFQSLYGDTANQVADAYGIPRAIFANMIGVESSWQPFQIGAAGEVGLTQVKPSTAAALGLDPWNPLDNMKAGAAYLQQQYQAFGNWRDALGAYNAGPTGYAQGGAATRQAQAHADKVLTGLDPKTGAPIVPGSTPAATPTIGDILNGLYQSIVAGPANGGSLDQFVGSVATGGTGAPGTGTIGAAAAAAAAAVTGSTGGTGAAGSTSGSSTLSKIGKYGVASIVALAAIVLGLYVLTKQAAAPGGKFING